MIKFELKTDTAEIKGRIQDYHAGDAYTKMNEAETLSSFDTVDEALKALSEYECSAYKFSSVGRPMLKVTEYWVEENEYDLDGEPKNGSSVVSFAPLSDATKNAIKKASAHCQPVL